MEELFFELIKQLFTVTVTVNCAIARKNVFNNYC